MRIRQGSEHDSLDNAEHRSGGADAESESKNHDDGEPRRFHQNAYAVAHILKKRFHEMSAGAFATFFLVALVAAEFDTRLPLGLFTAHAGFFQITGTRLYVCAQLLFHLLVHVLP